MPNFLRFIVLNLLLILTAAAQADTYTVDTTADTSIAGGCSTASPCSLRDAITAANLNPGADHIAFNIPAGMADPGHGKYTIIPNATGLPSVTDSVTIDATTQPGYGNEPLVELSGSGGPQVGLYMISHSSSVVRGFVINGFASTDTLRIGLFVVGGGSHVVAGNWFGTDATGLLSSPNSLSVGVLESDYNRFGGETPADRNIISGNTHPDPDVQYFGILLLSANHNAIEGNWLGLDKTGLTALPNNGEAIFVISSDYNTVGGSETKGNVVSATLVQQAVQVENGSYNTVSYNCFGTDRTCVMDGNPVETSPFTNGVGGTKTTLTINQTGPFPTEDNRIEHNTIVQNGTRAIALLGLSPVQLTGTVILGNIIESTVDGISVVLADETSVQNNTIDNALGFGIFLAEADDTSVLNNTIDNTVEIGIQLQSTNNTSVQNNTIDNAGTGIVLAATDDTSVVDNSISASGTYGVVLQGLSGTPGTNTQIANNRITNNTLAGIVAVFQQDLDIVENVVLKNGFAIDLVTPDGVVNGEPHHGIEVIGEISNVNIVDNWVGIDPGSPADTSLGNAAGGVVVGSGSVLQTYPEFLGIPEILVPQALLVAPDFGLPLGPDSVTIQGNTIAHNAGGGVLVGGDTDDAVTEFCSSGNLCINPLTGLPTIPPDYDDGIPGAAQSVTMLGNAIYANAGLAIDLTEDSAPAASYSNVVLTIAVPVPDGATANDGGDSDTGPNGLQNYPVLSEESVWNPSQVVAKGTLHSAPMAEYLIEFFANSSVDSSGHGEGEQFIGSTVVITDADGFAEFTEPTGVIDLVGDGRTSFLTSTATGPSGTSEFSPALELRRRGK